MSFVSKLRGMLAKKKQTIKVAWLGLDQAGKTTIIRRISTGEFAGDTKRTLGMNVDEFYSDQIKFVAWDIGGQETFREALWKAYMSGSQGVVYVIDSADNDRFEEAKRELWTYIINNRQVKNIPILVLANKQDLPGAKTAGEVARGMDLHKVFEHSYAIFPTSAKTAFNLEEALEWLRQRIVETLM